MSTGYAKTEAAPGFSAITNDLKAVGPNYTDATMSVDDISLFCSNTLKLTAQSALLEAVTRIKVGGNDSQDDA